METMSAQSVPIKPEGWTSTVSHTTRYDSHVLVVFSNGEAPRARMLEDRADRWIGDRMPDGSGWILSIHIGGPMARLHNMAVAYAHGVGRN